MAERTRWAGLLTLVVLALVGCTASPPVDDARTPVAADGVVREDLSDRFTLTLYPTTVYEDESGTYLSFRATIVNRSSEEYRDFSATVVLDPELDQYLAAGVEPMPVMGVDIFPDGAPELADGTGGRGMELVVDELVSDRAFLADAGLDAGEIHELGEAVTLRLRWDGGEETLSYTAPVVDPDGLLD